MDLHPWPDARWQRWMPPHPICNQPGSLQMARAGNTPATLKTRLIPSEPASHALAGQEPMPSGMQSVVSDGFLGVFCLLDLFGTNAIESLSHSKHAVECFGTFGTQCCNVRITKESIARLIAYG